MFSPQASIKGTSRLYEPVISLTITIEVKRRLGDAGEEAPHANQHERRGLDVRRGEHRVEELAAGPAEHPADQDRRAEDAAAAARADRQPGRDDLQQRQDQQQPHPHVRDERASRRCIVSSGGMPIAPHCTQPYPPVITSGNASASRPSKKPPIAGLSCRGIGIGLKK